MLWAWIAWVECIGASTRSIYQWNQVISLLDMTPSQLLRMFFWLYRFIWLFESSQSNLVSGCQEGINMWLFFKQKPPLSERMWISIGKMVAPSFTRISITRLSTWCFWLEARNRCVSWQRTLFVCYDRSGRSGWALGWDPLRGNEMCPAVADDFVTRCIFKVFLFKSRYLLLDGD